MKDWVKFALAGGVPCLISYAIFVPATSYWHYSQWSAAWFQAIGSLAAVIIALFYPWLVQRARLNNMKSVVFYELENNIKIVQEIAERLNGNAPSSHESSVTNLVARVAKDIDLSYWYEYRYEIASADLSAFEKIFSTNKFVGLLADNNEKYVETQHFKMLSDAQSALKNYNKNFG